MSKPYKFHIQLKSQRRIRIMSMRDTSSRGDTLCANMVSQRQTKKKLWAGHESAQTIGQTDRQRIPTYPLIFVHGGYKYLRTHAF